MSQVVDKYTGSAPSDSSVGVAIHNTCNTVVSSVHEDLRCKCGKRMECYKCRGYWVQRRLRASAEWLTSKLPRGSTHFIFTFTNVSSHRLDETDRLWAMWRKLGQARSNAVKGRANNGLSEVVKGVAALHLVNELAQWFPHLHGVVAVTAKFDPSNMVNAWKRLGGGRADVQPVDGTFDGWLSYAIDADLPFGAADRQKVVKAMHGKHLVRRIGS